MFELNKVFELDDEQEINSDNNNEKYRENIKYKIPWPDKYRPKKLNDITSQSEVINLLKETRTTGKLPNLLFYGPPGTGKTSSILAVANELFGPRVINERILELNASDERGINVVRYKIATFAQTALGKNDPKYLCPPYKIIILDEADAMTTEGQSALRKLMERTAKTTRFCFICNYINQIIEPISSRCMKFRFKPINEKAMEIKLKEIAEKENFKVKDNIISIIIKISNGDLRKAIMTLQNIKYIYNFKKDLKVEDVYEFTNYIQKSFITNIWKECLNSKSTDVEDMIHLADCIRHSGFSVHMLLEKFSVVIINDDKISDKKKSLICIKLGAVEKKLIECADEYIQLLNMLTYVKGIVHNIITYVQEPVY